MLIRDEKHIAKKPDKCEGTVGAKKKQFVFFYMMPALFKSDYQWKDQHLDEFNDFFGYEIRNIHLLLNEDKQR